MTFGTAYLPEHPPRRLGFDGQVAMPEDFFRRGLPPFARSTSPCSTGISIGRGAVPLLVDVRTPVEFASGHVPGAKNIPLDVLDARWSEIGTGDAEVYVICQSGARSSRASAALAAKGLHPVNVRGGTGAWISAGFPVHR